MRKTTSLFVALVAALVMAVPASAIQFGEPDGNNHPQVGVVSFFGTSPLFGSGFWRCTGTLIAPTKVLTAGHCTDGALYAWAFFDEVVTGNPWEGIPGVPVTKPGYDVFASFPASHDLAMVVLLTPQPGPYAELAPVGTVDGLQTGQTTFDVVGYGLQDARPPEIVQMRARFAGQVMLVNTKNAFARGYNFQVSGAPGTGGALCRGDSGGPVFLAGTTSIVAVASLTRNAVCMGNSLAYRTDTGDSLSFINSFGP